MSTAATSLRRHYDFIVCGAGPAGCVVAGRLAARPGTKVLLVEAGSATRSAQTETSQLWPGNVGSAHDWQFRSDPEPGLGGRMIDYSMGRIVGGGSSVNASVWARGHQQDWDRMQAVTGDPAWGYEAILAIYRRIETYAGRADTRYHGDSGPLHVRPSLCADALPAPGLCGAFIAASAQAGIPVFAEQNGVLQESAAGVSITDLAVDGTRRASLIDAYLAQGLRCGNLDLAPDTMVNTLRVRNGRAVGVELLTGTQPMFVEAGCEVIVAGGAVQTPALLMRSGIGARAVLQDAGIDCIAHLPGVGGNLQDHPLVSLVWKTSACAPVSASAQAVAFLDCGTPTTAPDAYLLATEIPAPGGKSADEVTWAIGAALLTPQSRGEVRIRDADPRHAPAIRANYLSSGDDLETLKSALAIAGHLGASAAMKDVASTRLRAPEPGNVGAEHYIRANMRSGWHLCGTARMGNDESCVVDAALQVYGVAGLRVCDTSVLPYVPRGNTMAPAIVVGERLSDILSARYFNDPQ